MLDWVDAQAAVAIVTGFKDTVDARAFIVFF